ncbi:alpha/beta-hydrolase [Rhizodiscina lignyota]|uniref:Alpha/beta-hydrolase n=1 Tax=Rhizodiscina lignyota TaxID=1504668 RepID=A0A9P4ILJ1_9PEZI|nr:alpha/beta-hydrolase [Rhizodiscina lignyota]
MGLCELISSKFDSVISRIDEEIFGEDDLIIYTYPPLHGPAASLQLQRSLSPSRANASPESSSNYFSKVWLYSNSRLPPYLPPIKLYMSTYPLICLAAQYSERVYVKPKGGERENHISAEWRRGTKAMVLKSLPIDDMNTIVFAIRGSQSIMDWCVNYRTAPTPPDGFLDDPGNFCHAGFLGVAKKTASIIAERLRALLQEDPGRSTASLLICGHSAGGAVAQLLYAHMMSQSNEVNSDLKYLTGFFKRVHCVTFGAPPVSLLPLQQPGGSKNRKSLFFSFVNEGDPVVRADKAVVASLLKLYSRPAPTINSEPGRNAACMADLKSSAVLAAAAVGITSKEKANGKVKPPKGASWPVPTTNLPEWNIPPGTLSLGGRLVLLRDTPGAQSNEEVGAFGVTDEQMRSVVFGDPVKHMMRLYARRVEFLATRAVTGQGFG